MNIALVEDDRDLQDELAFQLDAHGHTVTTFSEGQVFLTSLSSGESPDLVILDLALPDMDGLSASEQIRILKPELPIVIVTGRGALEQRLAGWESGALAYLVKPVALSELLAVIRNLERWGRRKKPVKHKPGDTGQRGWVLDEECLILESPEGNSIELTSRETTLLKILAKHAPGAAPRSTLMCTGGAGSIDFHEARRLEVAISRLRSKIRSLTGCRVIVAARGEGYVFAGQLRVKNFDTNTSA
jgi:DNA-binding response OmpR family regulator